MRDNESQSAVINCHLNIDTESMTEQMQIYSSGIIQSWNVFTCNTIYPAYVYFW